MNLQQVQNQKVRDLAQTLKNNGLAASDTEAIRMAESMTQTEDKVTKHFDEHRSSMVKNYDLNKTQQAPAQPIQTAQAAPQQHQHWEKEETAQEPPAPAQGAAPNHQNQALNDAISTVQQRYEQPAQEASLDDEQPLSELMQEERAEEEDIAPLEQPRVPTEQAAPMQVSQTNQEQRIAPQEPAEPRIEQQAQVPTAEETGAAYEEPIIEQPAQEYYEQETPEPQQPEETQPPTMPLIQKEQVPVTPQPSPAQAVPAVPVGEEQPETTKEVFEQPPKRDLSKMAESKVDLTNVFNVNK